MPTYSGTSGDDTIFGDKNLIVANDIIYGLAGNDILDGQLGSDTLYGGAGDDDLRAGVDSVSDTLVGGTGNDQYRISSNADTVIELANEGIDRVYLSSSFQGSYVLPENIENLYVSGGSSALGNALNNDIHIVLTSVTPFTVDGGAGNDTIFGGFSSGSLTLAGGAGNDNITSSIGNDSLSGGEGDDLIYARSGNDSVIGGAGSDSLYGEGGSDSLNGGGGIDFLTGDDGNNMLVGGAGNDIFSVNLGNDRILYDTNAAFTSAAIGVDSILLFVGSADKIVLDKTTFKALTSAAGTGFSIASEFAVVTTDAAAATSKASIVYNSVNQKLFYNQNGNQSGLGTGAHFANFLLASGTTSLSATNFIIQA